MKQNKLRLFFLIPVMLLGIWATAQDIRVFQKFENFEKEYFHKGDTTLVINFWATWCKPCVTELPYFDQLHASNTEPKTKIVLVSLDLKSQLKSVLMPFLKKNKISAEIVLLADNKYNDWLEKVHPDWSGTIPATLLLQGDLRQFAEREFHSLAELKGFVDEFKNKP